jgi:hypothetical protein
MMDEAEIQQRERDAALSELRSLLTTMPPGVGDWFHQRAVNYKAAYHKAEAVAYGRAPKLHKIREAIGWLKPFHSET